MHDFLILGAGVTGLATALELSRRGARVRVIDQGQPGQESSWAGAGILSALLPWDYPDAVSVLIEHSQAAFPAWIEALRAESATDPEYRRCGMLVRAPYDSAAATAWLARRGGSGAAPATLNASIKGIATDAIAPLWLPEVAQVRNPRLLAALQEALHRRGVEITSRLAVRRLIETNGRIVVAETNSAPLHADHFVVCTGAWSGRLLQDLAPVPIRPMRGQMLLYRGEPGRLPCIVYRAGRYLVPRADGHLLVGSSVEDVGFDKSNTAAETQALRAFAADCLTELAEAEPLRHWAGLRPGSPGNLPSIARHPRLNNLFINSGHFRYGVTMAPASAGLLADLALGHTPRLDPTPYRWPAPESAAQPPS